MRTVIYAALLSTLLRMLPLSFAVSIIGAQEGGYLPHIVVVGEYLRLYIMSCVDALFQRDKAST